MKTFETLFARLNLFLRGVVLAVLAVSSASFALAAQYGDFIYAKDSTHISIYDYTGSGGAVTIPETIEGLPVTIISMTGFRDCTTITSLSIPSGVTRIDSCTFAGCSGLTSIAIPSSVTYIGSGSFEGCSSLTSIDIPEGVTNIGINTFTGCSSLRSVTIPSSVISIMTNAFRGCRSLMDLDIPFGVTSIGDFAFTGCSSLTNITLPSSITSVGSDAFYGCRKVKDITISSSVTSIASGAFGGCSSLESITISSENPSYSSLDGCLFDKSRTRLILYPSAKIDTSYEVPSGVIGIETFAFQGSNNLKSVTIPSSVTRVGGIIFANCPQLEQVIMQGNAPSCSNPLSSSNSVGTIYRLDSATGFGTTYGGLPVVGGTLPTIAEQPMSQIVEPGDFVIFRISATGVPAPTLQWEVSTDEGVTWGPIPGATESTYAFTAGDGTNGNVYRCSATNFVGQVPSGWVMAVDPLAGFTAWSKAFFQGDFPSRGNWNQDPDGDGRSNLLEYALRNANPLLADAHAGISVMVSPNSRIQVTVDANEAATGVRLSVEFSDSPTGPWTPGDYTVDGVGSRIHVDPVTLDDGASRFYRVVVAP